MVLSGGSLARERPARWGALPLVLSSLGLAIVIALAANGAVGGSLVRVLAAATATAVIAGGWRRATGRERAVRGWIGLAVVVWFVSELARGFGMVTGQPSQIADLGVVGLAIGAIGTFVSAAHGRMRRVDEAALYLDAAAIFFGLAGAVIVIGSRWIDDAAGIAVLVHAAFFVGILAATLALDVTIRVPLRPDGAWELLGGLALGAIGYVGLLAVDGVGPVAPVLHLIVAAGALLVGHGGSAWSSEEDASPAYHSVTAWLRALVPLGSAVVTGIVAVALVSQPDLVTGVLREAMAGALGVVVVAAIARQTILLVDRERIIRRERHLSDELTVAEAQYRSVVERVPGVVYVAEAGQHGRWHFVSPKIEDLLGYTADEWTADPTLWMTRMHPADRDRMIVAETEEAERAEAKGRWEYRLIARDGRVVWVIDDEAVVARDPDGRPTMVQGILVDITDRRTWRTSFATRRSTIR